MNTSNINENEYVNHDPRHFNYIIPAHVLLDDSLSKLDLKIFCITHSFFFKRGKAFASNGYFSKLLNCDRSTVIRSINRLVEKKYLIREEINGRRYLKVVSDPMDEEIVAPTPPPKKLSTGGAQTPPPPSHPCDPPRRTHATLLNKIDYINNITTTSISNKPAREEVRSDVSSSNLLKLRDEYLPNDKRTDEEFLIQCELKLMESEKNGYTKQKALQGLETIIKKGYFEKPKENKAKESNTHYPTIEEVREKSRLANENDRKNQLEIAKKSAHFGKSAKEILDSLKTILNVDLMNAVINPLVC